VKGTDSFVAKATDRRNTPQYQDPLVEIEDQVAGRILVFFLSDISAVISALKKNYSQVESKRRRPAKDEEFGYESHHLICMIPPQAKPSGWAEVKDLPKTFELQIRTLFMHAWAEPQHNLGYKASEELPREIRRELSWVAASSWGADQAFERVIQWQLKGPAV
jgi:ppGpp synthetase/RelA/SpoT-type nucleotidyltranferase